jgi:hypothetical protein
MRQDPLSDLPCNVTYRAIRGHDVDVMLLLIRSTEAVRAHYNVTRKRASPYCEVAGGRNTPATATPGLTTQFTVGFTRSETYTAWLHGTKVKCSWIQHTAYGQSA